MGKLALKLRAMNRPDLHVETVENKKHKLALELIRNAFDHDQVGNFKFDYRNKKIDLTGVPWLKKVFRTAHTKMESDPEVWALVEKIILERIQGLCESMATNVSLNQGEQARAIRLNYLIAALVAGVCLVYYFSNPQPRSFYDYTFRIAGALLEGKLGLDKQPPSWLNEMVPLNGRYYSVFPLGSVLTMIPVALLQKWRLIESFPAGVVAAVIAGAVAWFCFLLSGKYQARLPSRLLFTLFPLFGTWMWCNLMFAGAWQIALGFAVLGQMGALYFTLLKLQPLIAGLFFALAFGNRTEVILVAPIFIYLIYKRSVEKGDKALPAIGSFLSFPVILGVFTLAYNYARFSSVFDFGYGRIPGVLAEPWYQHGIFSIYAIPLNARQMLFEPWKIIDDYPYLVPTGFGGSIFLNSPFLFLLFRRNARECGLKTLSWCAIGVLTLLLWCHGNPGGWQFSYRYAMVLLPWMWLILMENSRSRVSVIELILFVISVAINAYGTYLFLWTDYVCP